MGLVRTAKKIIFWTALIYLVVYFFPNYGDYFLSAKEKVTGFAVNEVWPVVKEKFEDKAKSAAEYSVDYASSKIKKELLSKQANSSLIS